MFTASWERFYTWMKFCTSNRLWRIIVRIQWESQIIVKYEWRQTLIFIPLFLILGMHIVDYQLCDRIYIIPEILIVSKRFVLKGPCHQYRVFHISQYTGWTFCLSPSSAPKFPTVRLPSTEMIIAPKCINVLSGNSSFPKHQKLMIQLLFKVPPCFLPPSSFAFWKGGYLKRGNSTLMPKYDFLFYQNQACI